MSAPVLCQCCISSLVQVPQPQALSQHCVNCSPDEKLKLTFMTNGVGPIIAYKYFRSLLEKGDTKMIVNFASNYGSMTLASEPLKDRKKATPLDHTQIAYKASKAAVNMGKLASLHVNLACIITLFI